MNINKKYVVKNNINGDYLKLNTLTDYNENSYFEGFSKDPETFFSSEYKANVTARQCSLSDFAVISI